MGKVLITGGFGYIGSHTAVTFLKSGYDVVIVDNLSNSKIEVKEAIEKASNKSFDYEIFDLRDKKRLGNIFLKHEIDAVIHFAGLKAVGESVEKPIEYYDNNIDSTICLLDIMKHYDVKKLVFSSSATVYSENNKMPLKETDELGPKNPYGRTKWMIEYILKDLYESDNKWHIALLRYFNPVGAIESGEIGEDPNGLPNNLMPYVAKVSVGEIPFLRVFGDDYETKDHTGVRDYIHVMDLARGHLLAFKAINSITVRAYNLGNGKGYSVLDVINTYEKVSKRKVPYKIVERRPGDVAICYANVERARKELGFVAKYDLEKMCLDAFNYQEGKMR